MAAYGGLDILLTNAGGPPAGPLLGFDDEAWQRAFESVLLSVARGARAALPYLEASEQGRIISIASSSIKATLSSLGFSNVFRPGIHGLVKTLAEELGPKGITVNLIAPGKIDTGRVRWLDDTRAERTGSTGAEVRAASERDIPLGPLRRARRARRGRGLPLLEGRALRLGHGHAGRRRPRARALARLRATRTRPAAHRGALHDLVGARGADRTRVGGLPAQRRSAGARPDRPRRVRAGAALRAARRARRRPSRPALRDDLRPRPDRAGDRDHRTGYGGERQPRLAALPDGPVHRDRAVVRVARVRADARRRRPDRGAAARDGDERLGVAVRDDRRAGGGRPAPPPRLARAVRRRGDRGRPRRRVRGLRAACDRQVAPGRRASLAHARGGARRGALHPQDARAARHDVPRPRRRAPGRRNRPPAGLLGRTSCTSARSATACCAPHRAPAR